jgi:hypothetical protein
MLNTIHVLLTYTCPLRCKHCFVYGGPRAKGTYSPSQVSKLIGEASQIDTVEWIYFEGGEPFYYYALLLSSIKKARLAGFSVGVITNGYFARSEDTAARFLRPLAELGVGELCISDDTYHYRSTGDTPAKRALRAAGSLGLKVKAVSLDTAASNRDGGQELMSGGSGLETRLMWRGRATEKLTASEPLTTWDTFTRCPMEGIEHPHRLDIDAYGNVQICQGITIGNLWKTSLANLVEAYRAESHPICGPLARGGPALLLQTYPAKSTDGYVDACHLCYATRRQLIDQFPDCLAPRHVYGLEKS